MHAPDKANIIFLKVLTSVKILRYSDIKMQTQLAIQLEVSVIPILSVS